jgi:hypothetical protein
MDDEIKQKEDQEYEYDSKSLEMYEFNFRK